MKKIKITACMLALSYASFGQLLSKKGEPILPESGDWAIGIDAAPILNWAGGLFSSGSENVSNDFLSNNLSITGKYFVAADMAYRGKVRLGFGSKKLTNLVTQSDLDGPNPDVVVEDSWKQGNTNIYLSGGIEKRKGKTRLQGFYGGELGIGFSGQKNTFEYGNAISADFNFPDRTSWGDDGEFSLNDLGGGAWLTESKRGSTISFGLRGFVGAEYFFVPKVSLGFEYGWGLAFSKSGKGEETYEYFGFANPDSTTPGLTSKTRETGTSSSFGFDTDNSGGSISLNFHF
jgi:hypothetical protein